MTLFLSLLNKLLLQSTGTQERGCGRVMLLSHDQGLANMPSDHNRLFHLLAAQFEAKRSFEQAVGGGVVNVLHLLLKVLHEEKEQLVYWLCTHYISHVNVS